MILYVILCYMSVWIQTLLEKVLNILIHAPNASLRYATGSIAIVRSTCFLLSHLFLGG